MRFTTRIYRFSLTRGALLAACLAASGAWAADAPQAPANDPAAAAMPAQPSTATAPSSTKAVAAGKDANGHRSASRFHPDRFAGRAGKYYELYWGVDSLRVKLVESDELVRFSYRVLDADKAQVLNDKQSAPSLIDPKAGVSLVVPTMEKIGQLRQSTTPEVGRSYWMTFSNKGRRVKRGDRVDVVIGQFKASNLVVD